MARKPSTNPKRAQFAALLAQHLANGTRPATGAGEPWSYAAFAGETSSGRSEDGFASQRSVSNWCKGKSLPVEIEPILRALFGPESGSRHAAARAELRAAFKAARAETVVRGKRDAAGVIWVPSGDQVIIDRSARPSDRRAAEDPLQQQLQAEIRELAATLVEPTKRLNNTRIWSRLSKTAADFSVLVSVDPVNIPNQLVRAYALLTSLGGFLETDVRVQRDSAAVDNPLDADIQGILAQLVRIAAPWLRGFPTVAKLDDAAGSFLGRADLVQPAREFTRRALGAESISTSDAAEMELLGETADAGTLQGEKAGNRLVGSSKNLMLTLARTGNEDEASLRVQRARKALVSAPDEVAALAATWPPDLHHALLTLVGEWRQPMIACFSSEGQLFQLPRGATPVDFAYAVRSQVGDTCVGARVNGRLVPLRHPLENGDQVEIITAPAGRPSPQWERFVVTDKARAGIRSFMRQQHLDNGHTALAKKFRADEGGSEKMNMRVVEGKNFSFDESGQVPLKNEEEIARTFLGAIETLRVKQDAPVFMGGPNAAGRILAAEQRRLSDGTRYILVRAATVEEIKNPGW